MSTSVTSGLVCIPGGVSGLPGSAQIREWPTKILVSVMIAGYIPMVSFGADVR